MAALSDIREGLRAKLAANLDLSPYTGVQISAYGLSNPTPPCIQVLGPEEITYHRAMQNGHGDWAITIQALVGLVSDRGAQELLDRMLESTGAASVRAAIEADKTLGGVVDDCIVRGASGYRQYPTAHGDVLGCEFSVTVIA